MCIEHDQFFDPCDEEMCDNTIMCSGKGCYLCNPTFENICKEANGGIPLTYTHLQATKILLGFIGVSGLIIFSSVLYGVYYFVTGL